MDERAAMSRRRVWPLVALSGLALALGLAGYYTDRYPLGLAGCLMLVGFVPGYGLLSLMPAAPFQSWLGRGFAALALSYAISVVLLMVLVYLTGAITPAGMLLAYGLLLTFLIAVAWRVLPLSIDEDDEGTPSAFFIIGLLSLIVLAAFLRIWGNQYSDLQGDEAELLLRATKLLLGTENVLVTHSKGPAEILIVAASGVFTGRLDEFTVRLPFALASVGGVVGVALLSRHLFGPLAGLVAGGLLAVNGVFVTYARTAQYQSLMFLFSVWAAWYFFDYYRRGRSNLLLLGAFLLAAAFLTHFEAILLLPLPVFLVWRRLVAKKTSWRSQWHVLAAAGGLLAVIVAAFYLPAFLNPQLEETGSYLAQRVGSAFPYNNFPLLYISSLTYNTLYYLPLSAGLLGLALLIAFKRTWRWSHGLFVLVLLGVCGLAVVLGRFLPLAQPWYLLILSACAALWLVISSRLPDTLRGLVVWGAPAWLVYIFMVVRPGNHYYVFFPAAALLAGWGIGQANSWLSEKTTGAGQAVVKGALGVILVAGVAMSAYYQYLLVVRTDLEYILTYPENRRPLFVTDAQFPFGTRIGFGFPYRLGWQMVSHLYRIGELAGDWGGNDDGNSPDWYTLGVTRTNCYPRHLLMGEITYKEGGVPLPFEPAASGYRLHYRIWDNGQPRMQVYSLDPLAELGSPQDLVEPTWYPTQVTLESLRLLAGEQEVVTSLSPAMQFSLSADARAQLADVFDPRLAQVRDQVALVGYQIDETWSKPGGAVVVTLYWQAVKSVHLPFKVFVHLVGAQMTVQGDDFPACGMLQMPRWKQGELITDRHLLHLPPDATPGVYRLEVGIYEPQTGLRMDKLDQAGNPAGNSFHVTDVPIR
jgi:4-amino-4-deoxy-L-arabinose transferase-like glycosyltransferase